MTLPAIRTIEARYPKASLYFITSPDGNRLFKLLAYNNRVIYRRHAIKRLFDKQAINTLLKNHQFDAIYCFETKKKYHHWLPSTAQCLTPSDDIIHFSKRCQLLVTPTIIDFHPHQTDYFSPNKAPLQVPSHTYPELVKQFDSVGIDNNTLLIGFHPSFSGLSRNKNSQKHRIWSPENFAKLAIKLNDHAKKHQLDLRIVIDLLPEEKAIGEKIVHLSGDKVSLFTPRPNFSRYTSYIKRLNLLVTPNTGVMHLAAAMNTPLVALFSHFDPNECGPYMPKHHCTVLQAEKTSNPELGLDALSVTSVFNSVTQLLIKASNLRRDTIKIKCL